MSLHQEQIFLASEIISLRVSLNPESLSLSVKNCSSRVEIFTFSAKNFVLRFTKKKIRFLFFLRGLKTRNPFEVSLVLASKQG